MRTCSSTAVSLYQNKREQLQGAVLTDWDTKREREKEENDKSKTGHGICPPIGSSATVKGQHLSELLLNRSKVYLKANAFWHNGKVLFGSVFCENSDEKTLKAFTVVTCDLCCELHNHHLLLIHDFKTVFLCISVSGGKI